MIASLAEECPANDYLFSLELATACTRRYGRRILELPVTLEQEAGPSSVSLLREAPTLLAGMLRIRRRRFGPGPKTELVPPA